MPKKPEKPTYQALMQNLKKTTAAGWAGGALVYVDSVRPFLHNVTLSGNYTYKQLEKALGRLHINDSYKSRQRNPNYRSMANVHFEGTNISVFFDKVDNFPGPWCMIQFALGHDRSQDTLIALNKGLEKLRPSKIEYATDIFFEINDPTVIEWLFKVIVKYIVVPWQRSVRIEGENAARVGNAHRLNYIARVVDDVGGTTGMKIYERGPDRLKDRETGGWQFNDLDRIRFEFTANRRKLNDSGIEMLQNLVEFPHFTEMNVNRWKFMKAKDSAKRLPKEWEPYEPLDEGGHFRPFALERKVAKEKGENIYYHTEKALQFEDLEKMMEEAWVAFDLRWQERWKASST